MVAERVELSVEQRNLQPAAYKNADESRCASGRIITSVECAKGNEQQAIHAKEYAVNLEVELQKVCDGILALMDESFIFSASTGEPRDFCYEMKGDYYRLLVDVSMVSQRHAPTIQKALKTVEVSQVQYQEVVRQVPVPKPFVQTVQKIVEVPQVPKISDVSVVRRGQVPKIVSLDRIPQRTAEQVRDIPVSQVVEEFAVVSEVFFQNRVQQRIVQQITETPTVSLAEEIVEAPKVQMQEEIICCLKENQSEFSEDAPLPSMTEEQIQEHIIEETDVPAPCVMEENSEVEKLKSQRFTLLADKKQASKLNGGCAVQAPECEELQKLRTEGLVAIHGINKLPNDNDSLELFKET